MADAERSSGVVFGDLIFELNPLTGRVRVTSLTEHISVAPIAPGVMDLSSKPITSDPAALGG